MMDRDTVQNMYSPIPKINWEISASHWFCYKNILWCTVLRMSNTFSCCLSKSFACKYKASTIPILVYLYQVPWLPRNNICSLYQNFSLQPAFPPQNSYTLCVSDNTLIKVMHKHNIRNALLPFLSWGFQKLFWTFSISLPVFSPNPSTGSSRYPCVHNYPSAAVSALLSSHMSQQYLLQLPCP